MGVLKKLANAIYNEVKYNYIPYLFVLPALSVIFIFTVLPAIYALQMSFYDWYVLGGSKFIGIENYSNLISMPGLVDSVKNTMFFAILFGVGTLMVSLLLAVLLNEAIRGRSWFRVIYYLPVVCSAVAISLIWKWMYWPTMAGLLNTLIAKFGLQPQNWLGDPRLALPAIAVMLVWKNMGYYMIIFLAGLQAIPAEIYEAATVDGARKWAAFRYITLPLLKPTTMLVSILLTIHALQIFAEVYVMTGGGPANKTLTIGFYMYKMGFEQGIFGFAAAVAYVLFAATLAFTIMQRKLFGQEVAY